jgi:hypothetical protein
VEEEQEELDSLFLALRKEKRATSQRMWMAISIVFEVCVDAAIFPLHIVL